MPPMRGGTTLSREAPAYKGARALYSKALRSFEEAAAISPTALSKVSSFARDGVRYPDILRTN